MQKNRVSILFVIILTFLSNEYIAGQSKRELPTISGLVIDRRGEAVISANISLLGTNDGTFTDINGKFKIKAPKNSTLKVSAISFKTKSLVWDGEDDIVIILEDNAININELVVIGYGTVKKSDVTGAVSSIKGKELSDQPVLGVDQALQGRVPGVQVVSNSGSPGGTTSVRIRGIGTVNDSEPLYVVDGMAVSNISYLNTNDIISIDILKDASASAIYGSRGANGVVLVSTRKGQTGKTKISFNGYSGFQNALNHQKLLNGPQWYDLQEEINKTRVQPIDLSKVSRSTSTDWMKEITRVAPIQSYNLSLSGGAQDIRYSAGVGYFNQSGTIEGTEFNRLALRFNSEAKILKQVTLGSNIAVSKSSRMNVLEGSEAWGVVTTAIRLEPVVNVYNNDGSFGFSPYMDSNNPVASIFYSDNKTKSTNVVGNIYLNADILKNLKLRSSFGVDVKRDDVYEYIPEFYVNTSQKNDESVISRGYIKRDNWLWENTLTYDNLISGKHGINIILGYTMEETKEEYLSASKKGIPADLESLKYIDAAQNAASASVSGSGWESAMISYLGRINYNFDERILATFSLRSDGSSKFARQNRYAFFPSFALAWKINNENFFKEFDLKWFNTAKVRVGWGQIGNQNIGNYLFQSTLTSSGEYRYVFGIPEVLNQGVVATNMANSQIKWETSESVNIGIDLILFENLKVVADYFVKTTKDMLLKEPIPYHMGYENGPVTNVGNVRNSGTELQLLWKDSFAKDFHYNIGFNFSTISNKVLSLGSGKAIPGGSVFNRGYATLTQVGYPIGVFWGYKTDGLVQNETQLAELLNRQPAAGLGDVIYKDMNGYMADGKTLTGKADGILNDADKTIIGSPISDFTYGINLGIAYKGVEISAFFDGVYGNEIFNATRSYIYSSAATNKQADVLKFWTPQNTNTNMPRMNGNDVNDNLRISDRYVEDGSFLRLKNIQLTYSFPEAIASKLKMENLSIFLSAQNLFTITKYSGIYPEIGQISATNYLSRGVDMGTYPQSRTITCGLNINF